MEKLIISFPKESFVNLGEAYLFTDKLFEFDKLGIQWDNKKGYLPYNKPKENIKVLEERGVTMFTLIEKLSMSYNDGKTITFRYQPAEDLHVIVVNNDGPFEKELLHDLITKCIPKNFSFAYLTDFGKSMWQDEQVPSHYEIFGRPYDHLPLVWDPVLSPILKRKVIDITVNPGHHMDTLEMSLMAAPEMWFGPHSWKYFDKRLVQSFPKAIDIQDLGSDVLYVKLFDVTAENFEDESILRLQSEFRKASKMDEIEFRLNDILKKRALPDLN